MSDISAPTPPAGAQSPIDNAASLIAGLREPAPEAAPTQETVEVEAEAPAEAPEVSEVEVEVEAEAEVEAESEEVEQEVETEKSAPDDAGEDADVTTVEAPVSWSAAEKAEFAELPANVQATIAQRESQRETAFQTKSTEVSERAKQLEEAVKLAQQSSLGQLQQAQALMAQAMDANGFGQEPDWDTLRVQLDRDDYMDVKDQWDTSVRRFGKFQQEFQQMQSQAQQQQAQGHQKIIAAENAKTMARWPEYANPKTRESAVEGMFNFLEGQGIERGLSANLFDSNMIGVVRLAMEMQSLKDAKPNVSKVVKEAPKMAKPGTAASGQRKRAEGVRDAMNRAAGSKNPTDIANVFAALRNS